MLFYNYSKEKTKKESVYKVLEDKIKKLRKKLDKSIEINEKYEYIYKLSIELDELIIKYYINREKVSF